MDTVRAGPLVMTWNPHTRIFEYAHHEGGAPAVRAHEETLAEWVRARTGTAPFGILVDGAAGRTRASGFSVAEMLRHRGRAFIACHGVAPVTARGFPMLAAITGTRVEAFATRREAEAWLHRELSSRVTIEAPSPQGDKAHPVDPMRRKT